MNLLNVAYNIWWVYEVEILISLSIISTEMTEVSSSQAGDLETSAGISVVHMPSLSQPIQVQSVIHSNTPSVIQTAGPNVQTIQVVRVCVLYYNELYM